MADSNCKELISLGEKLFSRKSQLDTLWQSISEECYPERSTFTRTRIEGDEFCLNLWTSLPAQNRRDLAYAMGALTRKKGGWFEVSVKNKEQLPRDAKDWLSWATDQQRERLYNRRALFQRTMQVADNDFVSFGNAVVMLGEDEDRERIMVFLPCHLRDCAWSQDYYQQVNCLHRKFKIELRNAVARYGMKCLSAKQKQCYEKNPTEEIELRHCVMPNTDYDAYLKQGKRSKQKPFISVYINPEAQCIVKEAGAAEFPYHVRRWFLDDQSAYGYSPAAMLGLVEARLLQSQERVIMDAGERVVDPPSVASRDAVLGQVANYAGATTWISGDANDGDVRKALQFIDTRANIPVGLEMKQDTRQILASAWFINKLTLPAETDMTAYEVDQRLEEYVRSIGPAVEPFEAENAALLDVNFSFNMRLGNFGPPESIPQAIQGTDTIYEFNGPVQVAYKRLKLAKAKELREYALVELELRPESADNFDFDKMGRDAASYIGAEPGWVRGEEEVAALRQQRADAMQAQQQAQEAMQMGEVLKGAIETVPAATEASRQIPELMKNLGVQGMPGQQMLPAPQGSQAQPDYSQLFAADDAEFEEIEEGEAMPRALAMPEEPEDDGVEDALRDLIATLKAPVKVTHDKDGKPTGWAREMVAAE